MKPLKTEPRERFHHCQENRNPPWPDSHSGSSRELAPVDHPGGRGGGEREREREIAEMSVMTTQGEHKTSNEQVVTLRADSSRKSWSSKHLSSG